MRLRLMASVGALTAVIGTVPCAAVQAAAQEPKVAPTANPTAAAKTDAVPRLPWGAPDLNGVWNGNTMTPLQRPAEYTGRPFLTREEVAAAEKRQAETALQDRPPRDGDPGTYNQVWTDPAYKVVPDGRTSLIVDPPDGKIPFTPEGLK